MKSVPVRSKTFEIRGLLTAKTRKIVAAFCAVVSVGAACAPAPTTTSTTTTAKPTTTIAPTSTTKPPTQVHPVHGGLGAWSDTYDWSPTVVGGPPPFTTASVDLLASKGVRTLYIQTSRDTLSSDIVDSATLKALISRAKLKGMFVVGWYLPTFVDQAKDLRRIKAIKTLGVDGIGVDIESLKVSDITARNAALVSESAALRSYFGTTTPLYAITFPPIHLQYVNPSLWPSFPWTMIGQKYDALITMSYWTLRKSTSPYRDPTTHVSEDLRLARQLTGRSTMPVHIVGGLAQAGTAAEIKAFVSACITGGCAGGSYYDATSTSSAMWTELARLKTLP